MRLKNKIASFFLVLSVLLSCLILSCAAVREEETALSKFYSDRSSLLCISHRGDTASYPENSLAGIKSALKKGADFVSVSLDKTADGVFYLCERESLGNVCNAPYESLSQMNSSEIDNYRLYDIFGKETEYKPTSLVELIENTDSKDGIILDVTSEHKDEVYGILRERDALYRVIIRVKESSGKLISWAESKTERVNVIAVYGGNIIFSTISAMNNFTKAEMPAVQYQSKNYFNVAYGYFFVNRYLHTGNARAVAATYSPDLCGQRGDSSDGWNELIGKGYSVIETNNIEAFVTYRNEVIRLEKLMAELLEKAYYVDPADYSEVSLSNLEIAKLNCSIDINSAVVTSLEEIQYDYSQLLYALKDMKKSSGEVDTRGALNITAGKVIAAVLVGCVLLAGQIYVYKMRKKTKENNI